MTQKKRRRKTKKAKKESQEITFKAFFSQMVNTKKLDSRMEREIHQFFKDHKLKDKEDLDTYLKVLEKY